MTSLKTNPKLFLSLSTLVYTDTKSNWFPINRALLSIGLSVKGDFVNGDFGIGDFDHIPYRQLYDIGWWCVCVLGLWCVWHETGLQTIRWKIWTQNKNHCLKLAFIDLLPYYWGTLSFTLIARWLSSSTKLFFLANLLELGHFENTVWLMSRLLNKRKWIWT